MDYPRMLYPNGEPAQDYRIVKDTDEDAAARAEGYAEAYSVAADAPKRRSQPPKVTP